MYFKETESNNILIEWDSPRPSRAKVEGFVIKLSINGNELPPIDLQNETHSYTITNLRPLSDISVSVLAYADRKLYLERKYVGRVSKTIEIILPPKEDGETGWFHSTSVDKSVWFVFCHGYC